MSPDPRFFKRQPPLSLEAVAEISGAQVSASSNPDHVIHDVASLQDARLSDLTFFDNIRYKEAFKNTKAGACFIAPEFESIAPKGVNLLVSKSPYKSYALAAQRFYPEEKPKRLISKRAIIDRSAKLGKACIVEPGAIIGPNVIIGDYCRIGANAVITHAIIGSHTRIYPGVCIGQDGFGFAIDPAGFVKVPQLGRVIIGDHVEIGANTTIDRGAGPDTVIGDGTWIDNLVQIGHNVKVGKGCVLVSQVGISGSTILEDYVMIGGQGGIAGHLHIGKGARIAAKAGVMRDIPAGEEQMGAPAMPAREFMRQIATLKRLSKRDKT